MFVSIIWLLFDTSLVTFINKLPYFLNINKANEHLVEIGFTIVISITSVLVIVTAIITEKFDKAILGIIFLSV